LLEVNDSQLATVKILVVDDERMVRESVVSMLKRAGYEVLSADGPRQALEIVKNNSPVHLVLSDIQMPEMRGTQLICELARLSPNTARVLMTGSLNKPADVPDGVPVLHKPFLTRALISAIRVALASSGQRPVPQ
jgi:two-component system, cell cycle sensor histidine kinase and response regulator CckA